MRYLVPPVRLPSVIYRKYQINFLPPICLPPRSNNGGKYLGSLEMSTITLLHTSYRSPAWTFWKTTRRHRNRPVLKFAHSIRQLDKKGSYFANLLFFSAEQSIVITLFVRIFNQRRWYALTHLAYLPVRLFACIVYKSNGDGDYCDVKLLLKMIAVINILRVIRWHFNSL